ncbi:MAG: TRAP transporter small permease subunit [Candidatus Schekmanbacteria bacterium]|nr:TRAP transporter small permease subunit [Candidatus Schekmanbacteria bacterium]
MRIVHGLDLVISAIERAVLFGSLAGMLALSFTQVVLRNVDSLGIHGAGAVLGTMTWSDVAARHLVLWLALAGAARTTRRGSHLGIDILSRLLRGRGRAVYAVFYSLVSAAICVLLGLACWDLLVIEKEAGSVLFHLGSLAVPTYIGQAILPFGFWLIAGRFILVAIAGPSEGSGALVAPISAQPSAAGEAPPSMHAAS